MDMNIPSALAEYLPIATAFGFYGAAECCIRYFDNLFDRFEEKKATSKRLSKLAEEVGREGSR